MPVKPAAWHADNRVPSSGRNADSTYIGMRGKRAGSARAVVGTAGAFTSITTASTRRWYRRRSSAWRLRHRHTEPASRGYPDFTARPPSRRAASAGGSPRSRWPLGNPQFSYESRIRRKRGGPPAARRKTTPPALVSRVARDWWRFMLRTRNAERGTRNSGGSSASHDIPFLFRVPRSAFRVHTAALA